jgi:hypothetical protein
MGIFCSVVIQEGIATNRKWGAMEDIIQRDMKLVTNCTTNSLIINIKKGLILLIFKDHCTHSNPNDLLTFDLLTFLNFDLTLHIWKF